MPTGRTPFARLADCEQALREEHDFTTDVRRDVEDLFYVEADMSDDSVEFILGEVVQDEHNLHLFTHDGKYVVSTVPKEIAEATELFY